LSKTISQLRSMWNREADSYRTQEVGSGVQRFVKEVLECPEIFNLKEGQLSTPLEMRKNEFIYEKKTKDKRRADFVIYISSDIIIPIEVEQYTNIEQGESQLSQYQSDLEKKYGILTDGYTWRFYNNNVYRVFTLDHLLSDTAYFLEFWKEYIKPEYYYLSFFEEAGQLSFFGKEELHIEDKRQLFFEDITTLIRSFRNKLRIEGYFNGLDKKEALKKATEITYAYIIQFILYKTLVDNRFDDFGNDYKGRIKTIHNAIKAHSYGDILGRIDGMSHLISENIYRPFIKEQEYIRGKLLELYHKPKNELSDVSPWLDIVVFIKKYNFQNVHNEIFGYVYENYLKELYEDEKKGQYFTDSSVVHFMLEQVGYMAKEIRDKIKAGELDRLSIVDPACGSGTFLYSATDEIVKSFATLTDESSKQIEEIVTGNVFGLDIEEFPLYLAEMNILMRMLPLIMGEKYNNPLDKKIKVFWTRDSIAEFIGSGLETTDADISRREGQLSYFGKIIRPVYHSYVRDEDDLEEMKDSMASFPRRRFDYVIGNPPYIGYNECSKKGVLITKLIRDKKVQLSDIYGVNLHSLPGARKKRPPKPNIYAFFIALGIALLKDNGRLCYIIPQTILINPDFDTIRYHIAKFLTIEKIITFSGKMFVGRGIKQTKAVPTSSLIFIVSKAKPSATHKTEVINHTNPKDTIGDVLSDILDHTDINTKKILQSEFLDNINNWNFIKFDNEFQSLQKQYNSTTDSISIYYDHSLAEHEFRSKFFFDEGYDIDESILKMHDGGYGYPILNENYWTIREFKGYWPNIRGGKHSYSIHLLKANQGYNLLDSKYKIVWSYNNTTRFFFTNKPVIWARNKILGIGSHNKREVLYLSALLNSRITELLLKRSVKIEQEETRTILVSLQIIKNQIRVPKINGGNNFIKDEIIKRTEEMLALEEKTLSDFVDFSGVLVQKLDDVQVEGNSLVLVHDKRKTELQIQGDTGLISSTIAKEFVAKRLKLEKRRISLSELRNLQVFDFEKQTKLKAYIDDLVFALYFKIPLKEVSLEKADEIRKVCLESKYYRML
jgi:hypothetical protein